MDLPAQPLLPHGLIQVAGVHDQAEAAMLLDCGVDLVGIPLRLTVNAEDLDDAQAASISRAHPGHCCLITYLDNVREIQDLARYLEVRYIQLHGPVAPDILPRLRKGLPGVFLIKSLVVGMGSDTELFSTLESCAHGVDAFITDTYNPETLAEGATGLTHDWNTSRRLVESSPRPVILAGGLNPGNLAAAIGAVRPHGVDVHTGVEGRDGRKNPDLVRAFVQTARNSFGKY